MTSSCQLPEQGRQRRHSSLGKLLPQDGRAPRCETEHSSTDVTATETNAVRCACPNRVPAWHVTAGRWCIRLLNMEECTSSRGLSDTTALLDELAVERGLSWSEIARLCSVSVSTARKWRSGCPLPPEPRHTLAHFAAFLDRLETVAGVSDPANWTFRRFADDYTTTAADLYISGQAEDLLAHAQGHLSLQDMLDRWNPEWRTAARPDWEVTTNSDGERVLMRRD